MGGMPESLARRIDSAIRVKVGSHWHPTGRWSIERWPSTGPMLNADLVQRTDRGSLISREPVLRDGRPAGRWEGLENA